MRTVRSCQRHCFVHDRNGSPNREFLKRNVLRAASSSGVSLGQLASDGVGVGRIPHLPAKMLGRLLSQPGAVRGEDLPEVLEWALRRVDEMDGKDCVRVLRAVLDGHARPDSNTLRALGVRLGDHIGDITMTDMAELAESLAEASVPDMPIFARLSVAFSLRATGATTPQLAKMAVSFSRVRFSDRHLFPRLAHNAIRQLHAFKSADLAAFLASFATVGQCNEMLLTASSKVVAASAHKLSALDLALVAFAYAQFLLVYPVIVDVLRRRLPPCAHELPPMRLAELVVSCGRLSISDPRLNATITSGLTLDNLSPSLFGQILKCLPALGLSSAPALQTRLSVECHRRLDPAAVLNDFSGTEWVLDVVEGLGETAEAARLHHGGTCPAFFWEAAESVRSLLAELCPSLGPKDTAGLYRSLRQMPESLVVPQEGTFWRAHEALARRATDLAKEEAFSFVELTSALFSQMCLYKRVWSEEDGGPVNPQWTELRKSWSVLSEAWLSMSPEAHTDPRANRQVALLGLLFQREDAEITGQRDVRCRMRPMSVELQEVLWDAGVDTRGPSWQGAIEMNAVVGPMCFCVVREEDYFKRHKRVAAFEEGEPSWQDGEKEHELCLEREVELQLLRHQGWTVRPVPFMVWRRLDDADKRRFLLNGEDASCDVDGQRVFKKQ